MMREVWTLTGPLRVLVHYQKRAVATTSAPASNFSKHEVLAFLPSNKLSARDQADQFFTQSVGDFGSARGCRDEDFGRDRRIPLRAEVVRESIDGDVGSGLLGGSGLASRRGTRHSRVRRQVGWVEFTRVVQGMWYIFSKTFLIGAMLRLMRAQ